MQVSLSTLTLEQQGTQHVLHSIIDDCSFPGVPPLKLLDERVLAAYLRNEWCASVCAVVGSMLSPNFPTSACS
jgi:hypothetical protein